MFRDYLPLLVAFALVALVLLAAVLLVWYLERRKRDSEARERTDNMATIAKRLSQLESPKERVPYKPALTRHRPALQPLLSRVRGYREQSANQLDGPRRKVRIGLKRGSKLLEGCQVAAYTFLIPWILTAALVWLFPGFSYGLVERWICPVNSSIQVHETGCWLYAVLSDDESVDFPQFTCVNSRGAVVFRGDSLENILAYLRVAGVVQLVFLAIVIISFLIISFNARKRKSG